ncbi:phage tail protein [Moraxella catarrhalis]|uniref:phage tail protein n=2 Tax=Moraxella catarrhalis TaxID=480 RepID=UPI0007229884|nr:phage tail protein [Moraxella catarrhalis]AKI28265.1 tail protein [Moraxella phage Mcat28]MDE4520109.1 phage tail protein [Moraxella catarrhalis]MPW84260.1 phage tail protein [Moraxella catarrhalis]MPW88692.1 phage tail protein [Moraxella catarrhalis]MPW92565.1 phage tail protein [Moraxella catarrhalis]
MKTFTWKMNMGASASVHHAVSKTQFGDGYAQRVSVGINNQRTDWSGSKTGDWQTVILPIKTFLDEHKGVIPFLWTNPHGQTKKYVCENYEISQKKGNFWEISLKFEQSNSDGSSVPLLDFGNQNSGTSTPNVPQSALDDINKKIQDEIELSTQKDDAHDKAIQSLNTSKTSLSKSIDEIKEQLAGVSSVPMSVAWDSITGKPSSFNPSSHSHAISDISGLQSLLNAKANSNHSHAWNSITDKPQSFTPSSHVHQASDIADLHTILSKYATKDEIPQINTDGLTIDTSNLATKTSVETLANKVTEASEALKSETKLRANSIAAIDSKITTEVDRSSKKDAEHDDEIASLKRTKADLSHTHTMSEVTDLSAELERYALKTELNNISVDTSHLATKSSVNELSEQIATKADQSHRHTITEVSGLQGILNNKLNSNASARSAQKLTTPRRINGIAFDGTQDITLPTPTNISWSAISNKPANFTPSAHRHAIGDITNLQRELDNKASRNHSHTWNSITNKPANFTPSAHRHAIGDITNLQRELDNKASRNHSHTWNSITDKPTTLTGYGITDAMRTDTDSETTGLISINRADSYIQGKQGSVRRWYVGSGSSSNHNVQLSNLTHNTQLELTNNRITSNKPLYVGTRRVLLEGDETASTTVQVTNHPTITLTLGATLEMTTFVYSNGRIVHRLNYKNMTKPALTALTSSSSRTKTLTVNLPTAMPRQVVQVNAHFYDSGYIGYASSLLAVWKLSETTNSTVPLKISDTNSSSNFSGFSDLVVTIEGF